MKHEHIVRAVAFPTGSSNLLATGGYDKQLRVFDLATLKPTPSATGAIPDYSEISCDKAFKVGEGVHQGYIKAIVWTYDPNVLVTAADDRVIRWWNLYDKSVIQELKVAGDIGSCEFNVSQPSFGNAVDSDVVGGGLPVLAIAAGKTVYFYGGKDSRTLLKSIVLPYDVASVALHAKQRKFVVGGSREQNTWAKVYDYDTEQEIGKLENEHLLVATDLSQTFIKVITGLSGASAFHQMVNSTPLEVRMEPSKCGRTARDPLVFGRTL